MSTPSFNDFNPSLIPFQARVIHDIYETFDFKKGVHEILLSGSIGSAKSILAAHLVLRHCLENMRARVMIGRYSLPDLKDTIFQMILEHLQDSTLVEGKDYWATHNTAYIRFRNGSEIISKTWADKKFKKFRSLQLSMLLIEELTESDQRHSQAFFEAKMRVGRITSVKRPLIIACTNPDSPNHWAYKYFMIEQSPMKHVYYSRTYDNPFLPSWYIENLKNTLDKKQAERLLEGKWVDIDQERIYYNYDRDRNFSTKEYVINKAHPLLLAFDFNIGHGKPMSSVMAQYIDGKFHFFKEVVVQGLRTQAVMDEWKETGFLDLGLEVKIYGDSSGNNRDTRSITSDYDIIYKFLSNNNTKFSKHVPAANPPIRTRHNIMNGLFKNSNGQINLYIYNLKVLDEGFLQTAFKKGASLTEDDSNPNQHVTTAAGYMCWKETTKPTRKIENG